MLCDVPPPIIEVVDIDSAGSYMWGSDTIQIDIDVPGTDNYEWVVAHETGHYYDAHCLRHLGQDSWFRPDLDWELRPVEVFANAYADHVTGRDPWQVVTSWWRWLIDHLFSSQ